MMIRRRRNWLIIGFLAAAVAIVAIMGSLHLFPLNILSVQQKPEQAPQKVYDYYIIIDEQDGKTLMYVPLVVSVGDELISEENKYYQVVRIEENRAYARFVKDVDLEKYKPPESGQSNSQQAP